MASNGPLRESLSAHALGSPLPFRPPHSLLVHSEVVRDLMPDRISQHLLKPARVCDKRSCGPWKIVILSGIVNPSKTERLASGRPW